MKCFTALLLLFCAEILGQVADVLTQSNNQTGYRNNGELSSGLVFNDTRGEYRVIRSFKAPGRTISDETCEEYKWQRRQYKESNPLPQNTGFITAIIGGRPTEPGEFPHMVALGWKAIVGDYVFLCGGTLLNSFFVLTAAHCSSVVPSVDNVADIKPKIVRLNDKNLLSENTQDVNILRYISYPDYVSPHKYYDIALIEMEHEVTFGPRLQPACLWPKQDFGEIDKLIITGWGVQTPGSKIRPSELQAAEVDLIESKLCDSLLVGKRNRHWKGLSVEQFCAGIIKGGIDTCEGDSGGPIQVKKDGAYYVIGVTSFGFKCAASNRPSVYTSVPYYLSWIESTIWT